MLTFFYYIGLFINHTNELKNLHMGEFSKRIGEIGEEIVIDFLSLIGWTNPQRNFDIPSINPEKHEKNTHGIDAFFHYRSPMISNTLENIIISAKFSKDKYKNDPIKQFKDYYTDLAMAIESFKKSELRNATINKHSNLATTFDRGILFWLNNVEEDRIDLSQKLLKIEIPKGYSHDSILLIDNGRLEFIYDAINFVKNKFHGSDVQFTYFNTGLNSDDQSSKNGNILPFQYLGSNILPLRAQMINNEVTFVLCTKENFEENELIKLMGLAKNIGANLQTNTILAFPDYNRLQHEQIINNTKQIFEEASFTTRLTIENYNNNFRN
jgi:hypothetical protein